MKIEYEEKLCKYFRETFNITEDELRKRIEKYIKTIKNKEKGIQILRKLCHLALDKIQKRMNTGV